jgi:RND family efflux transporter MFP subunit
MSTKRILANLSKIIIVLVLLGAFFYSVYDGFYGNSYNQSAKVSITKPAQVAPVRLEVKPELEQKPVADNEMSIVRAELQPHRYTTISSEVPAKIQKIYVSEGQSFKKGQVLIDLDCSLQKAQLIKAKAAKEAAENTYHANQRLYELDAIGKIELENSFSEFEKARGELIFTSATISKCTVFAPFNGKVAEQKAREEQYIQPGQPVVEIFDASDLELEFLVPSKLLVYINEKTPISIHIDETNKDYPVRIRSINAKTDAVSQSVKVIAVIVGVYPELTSGLSGNIKLNVPLLSGSVSQIQP